METASTGPLIPRRRLGAAFRELREARGATLQQTAKAKTLLFSPSKLSRIENGLAGEPHPRDIRDLIAHFGLDGTEQAAGLERLAEQGRVPGWWQVPPYTMPSRLDAFISCESAASRIESYVPLVVPGLLQTTEYATEVLRRLVPRLAPREIEQQVALRMARQRALAGRMPAPEILLVAPETVLRRLVGDESTMRGQLARLVASYDHPTIDFRVIPFHAGLHPAMEGGFSFFHFEDVRDPDIVALDTVSSTHFVDQKDTVRKHREVFQDMQQYSLSRSASHAFLKRLRDGADIWSAA